MTDVDELRADYEVASGAVSRAERDRSQLLATLSTVTAAANAARRGTGDGVPDEALEALESVPYDWEYAYEDLAAAGVTEDRRGFQAFDIDGPDALLYILAVQFANRETEDFRALADCLADAIAGGGTAYEPLADRLRVLRAAFDADDSNRYEGAMNDIVDGFENRGAENAADFRTLLAAERGPRPGSEVLAMQTGESIREAAVDALRSAIEAGDADAIAAAREPFADALEELDGYASSRREDLGGTVADLTDAYPEDPDDPHPGLDHETPVLLTPTRLETRFVEVEDPDPGEPPHKLLVRVYPDDLHVDTHEPALTDAEVEGGARFWRQLWWASHDEPTATLADRLPDRALDGVDLGGLPPNSPTDRHEAVRERAWTILAERFGPERAAWVKRAMAPDAAPAILGGPEEMGSLGAGDFADFENELDERRQSVDRRPAAWTRPPRARLLPDRWLAIAEADGDEITETSEPVTPPLSIGPDPDALGSELDADDGPEPIRRGEMKWVFDFDAAKDAGMALEIPLDGYQDPPTIDRLVVLGVSTGRSPTTAAAELADLLESHHYTDGLSLLERGTPTNDTREDRAGTTPSGDEAIYERACTRPAVLPTDDAADGAHVAELLGIEPSVLDDRNRFVFERVRGADRSLEATAEAVNAALWSATLGYYVPHLLAPNDWTDDDVDSVSLQPLNQREQLLEWLEGFRRHFVSYVRPGGPLPPLRIADQPYGIVPTTAQTDWDHISALYTQPETDVPDTLGDYRYKRLPAGERTVTKKLDKLLSAARPIFETASEGVPGVDSADDPDLVASELLEMSGTSYGYRLRDLLAADSVEALRGQPLSADLLRKGRQESETQLEDLTGIEKEPRLSEVFPVDGREAHVVDAPITSSTLASSLRTFRTTRHDGLRSGLPGEGFDIDTMPAGDVSTWLLQVLQEGADGSLTEILCYHALLQEYRLARIRFAYHYEDYQDTLETGLDWEETPWSLVPEKAVYDEEDSTMWEFLEDSAVEALREESGEFLTTLYAQLDGSPANFDQGWTVGDLLRNLPPVDRPFAELIDAFETLEDADQAILDQLVPETLDAASHRYDAWATSLSTRRLDGMREAGAEGLYVGAYGYLEDLEPRADDPQDERTKGYVHAPSIDQATAAAVLRSAHDAETEEYGDLFAVDLSADRVREAIWLLEGVRAGNSLGELVGARFERALHEDYPDLELDKYVYPLRSIAPLVEGSIDRENMDESDAVAERDVVDGERLYDHWQTAGLDWNTEVGSEGITLPPENSEEADAIVSELEAIGTAFDSLSDVLAAEGVYQLVRDNPERAGAALDALSRGGTVDDVEVTRTPRTGTSTTHRLLTLLDEDATESPWVGDASPRAVAEPALEDWLASVLGDPARVVCRVAYEPSEPEKPVCDPGTDDAEEADDSDGEEDEDDGLPNWRVVPVWLSELDVSALDVVSLVEGDEEAWGSELEARIEYHVRRTREDLDADGEIRIGFGPPERWPDADALSVPDDAISFGELLEVARSARSVVSNARPVDATDLSVPGEAGDDGQVVGDLEPRASDAVDRLADVLADLDAQAGALATDEESDDRPVEHLVALVDAVADLPTEGLADADAAIAAVDGSTLQTELQDLQTALTDGQDLVATDDQDRVVLTPGDEGILVEGLGTPGDTLTVRLTDTGSLFLQAEVDVADDGWFNVRLETDALSHGDEVTVTVLHEDFPQTNYDGVYLEHDVPETTLLPELRRFATVVAGLEPVATAADPVVAAGESLDGDAIDAAIDRFDGAAWTATAAGDLADVRAVPDASVPGLASLSHWDAVGELAQAVAADEVTAGLVEDALKGSVPPLDGLRELCLALSAGIDALLAGTDAAGHCPDLTFVEASLETARQGLLVCADYGIHGAVPLSATGASREDLEAARTLGRQAKSVHEEAAGLLETAESDLARARQDGDPEAYVGCLESLFGEEFTVLVPFEPPNAAELGNALDSQHSRDLQDGDSLAVERWFDRSGRVRDGMDEFGQVLTYAETIGEHSLADGARFRVGQLPYEADDTWVGLPAAWSDEHPSGRLSLVAHVRGSQTDDRYVGLFVDEFVETVPNDQETTGVSVHYDRPSNQAPQSLLLAVPPTDWQEWSVSTLADVVRESVDLAKLRTVDPEELGDYGQVLPGLAFASNESADPAGPDTPSVEPDDLLADWKLLDDFGGGA